MKKCGTSVSFQRLVAGELWRRKFILLEIFLGSTILGILSGALTAEGLRRIVQAILNLSAQELSQALLFFTMTVLLYVVSYYGCTRGTFFGKKQVTFFFEDSVYVSYAGQKYWMNQEDAFGQIRKNITETVESYLSTFISAWQTVVALVAGGIYAGSMNLTVLVIAVSVTLLFLWLSARPISRLEGLYREIGTSQGKLYSRLWEQVENREIAKFLIPERTMAPYEKECDRFLGALLPAKKISNATEAFSSFGGSVMVIVVALIGGRAVLQGQMSLASLLALIMVVPTITSNLFWLPKVVATWRATIGRSDSFMHFIYENRDIAERESLTADTYGEQKDERKSRSFQHIVVQDLSYAYNEDTVVLKGLSLELYPGRLYAVAGRSGCGKTTFLKVLARLLPYSQGEIRVDGRSLAEMDREAYWENVCYAAQDAVILQDSLQYNIAMKEDLDKADQERLLRAIRYAQLEDFLEKQAEGTDTVISPDKLSKGECQKVSVARAIYRDSGVVLLDEATSALDPASEERILEYLQRRAKESGQIVIFISHRTCPLRMADEVLFFSDGLLCEQGTHDRLLGNEAYRRMVSEEAD